MGKAPITHLIGDELNITMGPQWKEWGLRDRVN
jgi:hypothetical protein